MEATKLPRFRFELRLLDLSSHPEFCAAISYVRAVFALRTLLLQSPNAHGARSCRKFGLPLSFLKAAVRMIGPDF